MTKKLLLPRLPNKPLCLLNNAEIKLIFENFPINKWALLSIMVSSGMTLADALNLKLADVDFNFEPTRITMKRKMTGLRYVTFLSKDATLLLKLHIKTNNLVGNDDILFPWKTEKITRLWRKALGDAEIEKMSIFALRRFFYVTARRKAENHFIVDLLVGHIVPEMRTPEFSHSITYLESFFRQIEPELRIFNFS
jgi:integrase